LDVKGSSIVSFENGILKIWNRVEVTTLCFEGDMLYRALYESDTLLNSSMDTLEGKQSHLCFVQRFAEERKYPQETWDPPSC